MPITGENVRYWMRVACDTKECDFWLGVTKGTREECLDALARLGWLITDSGVLCRACREREATS